MAITFKKLNKEMEENGYIVFNKHKYYLDFNKVKEICLSSSLNGGSREFEISQVYEAQNSGELALSSKVEHETKVTGNAQNDMIMYDILKLLLVALLEDSQIDDNFKFTFSSAIAFNTLINWGVLVEIK